MGFWQTIRGRLPGGNSETPGTAEVEHLAHLKESARTCRLECAAEQRLEEQAGNAPSPSSLAAWKKRVADAEARYALARHAWDNKQWRLKGS